MIRYGVSERDLKDLVEAEKPGWQTRAHDRTETARKAGRLDEESHIWSEVKPVFMQLQGDSKCAFCERKLESEAFGRAEQAVEHFRPKGRVKAWTVPSALKNVGIKFSPVPKNKGYYLLAYHLLNYAASCHPCNSALKRDYFPIAGTYEFEATTPRVLSREKPYLLFPIGGLDDDPEGLIRFHGVSPQPVAGRGHARDRAMVTIEFFKLDDVERRKNLIRERALCIIALYPQLKKLQEVSGRERAKVQELVDGLTSSEAPHTNCARSFRNLYARDPAEAEAICDAAVALILSIS